MNIVIFGKEKLSRPNKIITCPDYPINKISTTKTLAQQRSNKMP